MKSSLGTLTARYLALPLFFFSSGGILRVPCFVRERCFVADLNRKTFRPFQQQIASTREGNRGKI